ncbi:protoporphyrinogen oxidase [Rhodopirellula sp. SWK7]|uniref:protoporphyrinogen oxidase n=1 Tax=Rhodopirellula sp. SWK7 TaxID=595460 RepID=UPI0002BFD09C|nr:protoporphyrinogen oxidase [Rhodopirellula sp. SWK7]EMI47148.1 protoporphyrinogen IX and coproporphyrinogen III oxidase [Rhodopirellula sp. SWK7]
MTVPRIAVVGGGLSGLAVAMHLRLISNATSTPFEVSLFESSDRLGGVINTERIVSDDGLEFIVDHGADMFATNPPAAIDLCRRLGVEEKLLRPNPEGRGAMIARGNGLIPIPEGFVLMRPTKLTSMLTTKLLSPGGKLRLLRERFVRRRDPSVSDESVGSFVRRRLGRECLDNIVAPLVAGIYTADVDRLSMAATMKPIWEMEASDGSLARATLRRIRSGDDSTERGSSGARYEQFRAFPGGMIEFIQTLADSIGSDNIHTRSPIESLQRTTSGFEVKVAHASDPADASFDAVVLTTPAPVAANLMARLQPTLDDAVQSEAAAMVESNLRSISYASTAIVVMAIPRERISRMPKTFGIVVPPRERRSVLAVSFASEKFSGRSPNTHVIIRSFVGGVLHPEILENDDAEIVQIVARELADLIGLDDFQNVQQHAAFVKVVRWNKAMPQYEVGHLDRASAIRTGIDQIPGVELMTNAIGGVGIAPVIGAAERTAHRVVAHVTRSKQMNPTS